MARTLTQISVGRGKIAIIRLDDLLESVERLGLEDDGEIRLELVRLAKKDNYIPSSAESEYADALFREYKRFLGEEVEDASAALEIEVLGPGCVLCDALLNGVFDAVAQLNAPADVRHVKDVKEIGAYGAVLMPALVIDGKVEIMGKTPSIDQIKQIIAKRMK